MVFTFILFFIIYYIPGPTPNLDTRKIDATIRTVGKATIITPKIIKIIINGLLN